MDGGGVVDVTAEWKIMALPRMMAQITLERQRIETEIAKLQATTLDLEDEDEVLLIRLGTVAGRPGTVAGKDRPAHGDTQQFDKCNSLGAPASSLAARIGRLFLTFAFVFVLLHSRRCP